jgi:DNA-directed RNA polymerase subunit M/transcription elongation factor TFIIS
MSTPLERIVWHTLTYGQPLPSLHLRASPKVVVKELDEAQGQTEEGQSERAIQGQTGEGQAEEAKPYEVNPLDGYAFLARLVEHSALAKRRMNEVESDGLEKKVCGRNGCKGRVITTRVQTRAADEGASLKTSCFLCGHTSITN